jgi:tetratricopeptide (TPR) repeat protein
LERDPKAPHGAIDLVARGVTDLVIKSGRKIPGVGLFLEGADSKVAGETLAQLINYGITRWGNKDEVLFLRDTERVLTPLFLDLLAKASSKRKLVLMFDVLERTGPSLAPWLLALFNFEYGEFDTNLTFVISGRDPLEQHWTKLVGTICHMALEPFTPDETRLYLNNQSIYDDQLVRQIHEDTEGLPVLVELLATTKPQPGMPLPDVSKDAVERFLQWIPQEERRRVALLAAVPRQFNRDLLSATLGSDATNTFAWLSTQSFVRVNAERGWFYHEKVRELMLRHLRHTTPKDLEEAHMRLAVFFAHEQAKLNLEGETAYDSEAWRMLECERVYHIVSAQPDSHRHEAINAFFHAFRWHWSFAEDIARALQQLGHERGTQTIRDWASRLLDIYKAYDQEEYLLGVEQLASFETQSGLTAISCCEIHALRGYMSAQTGKGQQALADLHRAIELDEQYAWAIAWRGVTYGQMDQFEEALADLTRAIELDEQYAWAIAWRGETYWQMDKYEEALADFTRAVELDGDYVWAITYRGETHKQMGKYEEALADFTRAIELDKQCAWALESRGEIYQQMGKYEEAVADLTWAIELNNKDTWALAHRGKTYQQMGKHEEALTDLTHAIELDEKFAWAVSCRGETYRRMAQYEEAIVDFNRVADLGEADAYDFSRRAAAYLALGNAAVAQTDLSRAMELPLEDAYDFYSRAITLVLSKKCDEAIEMLIQAFERDVTTWILAETDDLLDPIRNLPQFQSLIDSTTPPWRK